MRESEKDLSLFVVVVAAGLGTRLGKGDRKAALTLASIPLVVRSLRAFAGLPAALGGALVVHSDDIERATEEWLPAAEATFPWQVVVGGATRAESCANGLAAAPERAESFLVHDAARPLLAVADRDRVVAALREHSCEGAILAAPVTDTLKRVAEGQIVGSEDRSGLWRAQTPQVFTRGALERARRAGGLEGTDEASWLTAAGCAVRVVESQEANPKITRPADLEVWEAVLDARARR